MRGERKLVKTNEVLRRVLETKDERLRTFMPGYESWGGLREVF